jgi:hypothetical protein
MPETQVEVVWFAAFGAAALTNPAGIQVAAAMPPSLILKAFPAKSMQHKLWPA